MPTDAKMAAAMAMCVVCQSPERESIEALGLQAAKGELSWSEAARQAGLSTHKRLQNHMGRHYTEAMSAEVEDSLDQMIAVAISELNDQFLMAPPEVKPLYAAAIVNLRGLKSTNPSQQHLIMALRTIQELTGMKQEQRLMLAFAERMFQQVPSPKAAAPIEAPLEDRAVIDVEEVKDAGP